MLPVASGIKLANIDLRDMFSDTSVQKPQLLQLKYYCEPISSQADNNFNLKFSENFLSFLGVGQSLEEGKTFCLNGLCSTCAPDFGQGHPDTNLPLGV